MLIHESESMKMIRKIRDENSKMTENERAKHEKYALDWFLKTSKRPVKITKNQSQRVKKTATG